MPINHVIIRVFEFAVVWWDWMQKRKDADFPNVLKHLKIYNFFFFCVVYYIILYLLLTKCAILKLLKVKIFSHNSKYNVVYTVRYSVPLRAQPVSRVFAWERLQGCVCVCVCRGGLGLRDNPKSARLVTRRRQRLFFLGTKVRIFALWMNRIFWDHALGHIHSTHTQAA